MSLNILPSVAICVFALTLATKTSANTPITVNVNVEHSVNGYATFDRKKYVTMHSNLRDQDWNGEEHKLRYLLDELNVYFGRDNGSMNWYMQQAEEDPNRPGFADPDWFSAQGNYVKNTVYGQNEAAQHDLDYRNDVMIGGQAHVFWHGASTSPCCGGTAWDIDGPEAMGEFMGRYLNAFYRDEGQLPSQGPARPALLEILNEPLYELVDTGTETPLSVFQFHNDVAAALRAQNDDVLIGGYTAAFPFFDERNFERWHDRMKLFIDTSGDHMDFFSVHLYDFNTLYKSDTFDYRGPFNFKGSRIRATFDMMEQYSMLSLGEVKPYVISEYGGRDHELEADVWSPLRDWHFMKAFTPMMLQFMERPDVMLKAIPFVLVKATWSGEVYDWRLLRQANEAPGETSEEWVFTEFVKFYELWSEVSGTRVDTVSGNPDVLVDAYVHGDKTYVIVSNLVSNEQHLDLNVFGAQATELTSVTAKHLYLAENSPVLENVDVDPTQPFVLKSEASAIFTFDFTNNLLIDEYSKETKHYADTYLKPIAANQPINFSINNVTKSEFGEAFLRLSIGREHGLSLQPVVMVNGTAVSVPENLSGDEQRRRDQFFGAVDIPIPYNVLDENNNVSITFDDAGGHVSTATLSVFNFSHELRTTDTSVQVPQISAQKNSLDMTEFTQGSGEQTVMEFTLNADVEGAQLHSLTFKASGELDVTTDVTNVRLYRTNDDNAATPALIESTQFTNQNSNLLMTFDSPLVLLAGENRFHITYEF